MEIVCFIYFFIGLVGGFLLSESRCTSKMPKQKVFLPPVQSEKEKALQENFEKQLCRLIDYGTQNNI